MSEKIADEYQSSISLCQPNCGYYFNNSNNAIKCSLTDRLLKNIVVIMILACFFANNVHIVQAEIYSINTIKNRITSDNSINSSMNTYYYLDNREMDEILITEIYMSMADMYIAKASVANTETHLAEIREKGTGLWGRMFSKDMELLDDDENPVFTNNIYGGEFGYDFCILDPDFTVGLTGTIISSDFSMKENQQKPLKSPKYKFGGAYVQYVPGKFFWNASLRYGNVSYDLYENTPKFKLSRGIAIGHTTAGYRFQSGRFSFEPQFGLDYGMLMKDSNKPEERVFDGGYFTAAKVNLDFYYVLNLGLLSLKPFALISLTEGISGEETLYYKGTASEKADLGRGYTSISAGTSIDIGKNISLNAVYTMQTGGHIRGGGSFYIFAKKLLRAGAKAGAKYATEKIADKWGGNKKELIKSVTNVALDSVSAGASDIDSHNGLSSKRNIASIGTFASQFLSEVRNEDLVDLDGEKTLTYLDSMPKAVNENPDSRITELDKDKYLKKISFSKRMSSGKDTISIPSFGILFKIGKSDVMDYYYPMLDAFVDLYQQSDGNTMIYLQGYSSNAGNETGKNPELSKERALKVADYLMKKGIPGRKIVVKPHKNKKIGSGMFKGDPNCNGGQCYRRVDVSIK